MVKRIVILILLTLFPLESNAISADNYLPVEIVYNCSDPYWGHHYLEDVYAINLEPMDKKKCLEYLRSYPIRDEYVSKMENYEFVFFYGVNWLMTACLNDKLITSTDIDDYQRVKNFPIRLMDEQLKNIDNPKLYKAVIDSYE